MLQGPVVSLATFAYRPLQVLQELDHVMVLVVAIAMVLLSVGLLWTHERSRLVASEVVDALRTRTSRGLSEGTRRQLRLLAAGVVMLALAYPLTFTIRAYAISGRDTRVHLAAVAGAAVFWAGLADGLLGLTSTPSRKRVVTGLLAAHLAFMAGFGLVVQRSYVRAWELQRDFWSAVIRLCPDLEDGTVILVEPEGLEDPRFIYANHWNLPRVLPQVLDFPEAWENEPRVYRLAPGWEDRLLADDGSLRLEATTVLAPPSLYTTVDPRQVILLDSSGWGLTRRAGGLVLGGQAVELRDPPSVEPVPFDRGPLYPDLIGDAMEVPASPE
jgi:hypothetical protein